MQFFVGIITYEGFSEIKVILDSQRYSVGRHSSCDISILDKYVSRHHCTLVLMPPDRSNPTHYYTIADGVPLGARSANGTWVNSERIYLQRLKNRDVITFGGQTGYPKMTFVAEYSQSNNNTASHEYIRI